MKVKHRTALVVLACNDAEIGWNAHYWTTFLCTYLLKLYSLSSNNLKSVLLWSLLNGTCPFISFNSVCPPYTWGENCRKTCFCHHKALCNPQNGVCNCYTVFGYFGKTCNNTCLAGSFGRACSSVCNCTKEYSCHHVTGKCVCGANNSRCPPPPDRESPLTGKFSDNI